jgi:hypothetical protein
MHAVVRANDLRQAVLREEALKHGSCEDDASGDQALTGQQVPTESWTRRTIRGPHRLTRRLQSRYTESVPQHTAPSITLPPDPVIEAYKKDIDRTLLRETLKLTPAQRLQRLQDVVQTMAMLRGAARPKT